MTKNTLLDAIFSSATNHAIITMDNDGRITSWNTGAENILGFTKKEILGKNGNIIFTEEDRLHGIPQQEFDAACRTGRGDDFRWHMRKDGSRFWGEGVVTPLFDQKSKRQIGFLKIVYDATDKKHLEDELLRLANFDTLTNLPNRHYLHTRLGEMMAAMSRSNEMLILQVVDLDYFKQINDNLGHEAGDWVLQAVAQRMRVVLRETDFIARLGGDEFIVLQPNAHSPEAGAHLAEKIIETLDQPFSIDGHEVHLGASIGIALFPQDATDAAQLLKKADLALYKVKNHGRSGFSYFTEQLNADAHTWSRNLGEIKRCVEQQAYWLAYQPVVDTATGHIASLEALVRFQSPLLANYPVDDLLNHATEIRFMPKIGDWVLHAACAQHKKWTDQGLPAQKISVNFFANQLMESNVLGKIESILAQYGLRPGELQIEIPEREMYTMHMESVMILQQLRALGITIVLDNFGSSYSSLNYLRQFPVDRLKLDRKFLQSVTQDHHNGIIADATLDLAHALNIQVIAEGVESAEQVDYCRKKKYDAMQGFYFGRPMSEDGITPLLLGQRNRHEYRA